MFGWFKSKKEDIETNIPPERPIEHFENPSEVLKLFTNHTGMHFQQKESVTASKLISFCHDHAIYSFEDLHHQLIKNPSLFEALINTLTVNETYFFREMGQIDFICDLISRDSKSVRILCAPGSTGEEPYTIAISLLEKGIAKERIDIVSIDINSDAVAKAKIGKYSQRSLHKCNETIKKRYFDSIDQHYQIKTDIRDMVHFHQINLFEEAFMKLGSFDIIFSRNMLIYFDRQTSQDAINRLSRLAKNKDTFLFFGHADIVHPPQGLQERYEHGIRFYTL